MGFLRAIWAPGRGSVSTRAGGRVCGVAVGTTVGVTVGTNGVLVGKGVCFLHPAITPAITSRTKKDNIKKKKDGERCGLSELCGNRIGFSPFCLFDRRLPFIQDC